MAYAGSSMTPDQVRALYQQGFDRAAAGHYDGQYDAGAHQRNHGLLDQQVAAAYPGGATAQAVGNPSATSPGDTMQAAIDALMKSMQPQQAAQVTAPSATPHTIAGQNLDPYLNPYTQNVIDRSLGTMEDQRLQVQNKNDAAAAAAGAFGGSRHGILGSETNAAFAENAGNMTTQMNQANHNAALNLAGADVNSLNGMAQFNVANQMNANMANANALNNMTQFNSGQALNVGNSLANVGGQMFGMQNTANQNLANDGAMQQSSMQNLINALKGQTAGALNAPQTALGPILSALGGIPGQGGTSTTSKKTGAADWLALLL